MFEGLENIPLPAMVFIFILGFLLLGVAIGAIAGIFFSIFSYEVNDMSSIIEIEPEEMTQEEVHALFSIETTDKEKVDPERAKKALNEFNRLKTKGIIPKEEIYADWLRKSIKYRSLIQKKLEISEYSRN